ncbi:Aste57867_24527 [Aphanomyces stellatus]|uniref:Aste57867_24527 protein n=1 Tax=Aphanomyces stellatus TaxID=120398 RepID=A0A485LRQ4_9STRA|nr:hypothetical protein As57867_024450 [Aphanomyces stellatus]VFU01166.1 Aste57867_24527 [Aphanomyces stellatus]
MAPIMAHESPATVAGLVTGMISTNIKCIDLPHLSFARSTGTGDTALASVDDDYSRTLEIYVTAVDAATCEAVATARARHAKIFARHRSTWAKLKPTVRRYRLQAVFLSSAPATPNCYNAPRHSSSANIPAACIDQAAQTPCGRSHRERRQGRVAVAATAITARHPGAAAGAGGTACRRASRGGRASLRRAAALGPRHAGDADCRACVGQAALCLGLAQELSTPDTTKAADAPLDMVRLNMAAFADEHVATRFFVEPGTSEGRGPLCAALRDHSRRVVFELDDIELAHPSVLTLLSHLRTHGHFGSYGRHVDFTRTMFALTSAVDVGWWLSSDVDARADQQASVDQALAALGHTMPDVYAFYQLRHGLAGVAILGHLDRPALHQLAALLLRRIVASVHVFPQSLPDNAIDMMVHQVDDDRRRPA